MCQLVNHLNSPSIQLICNQDLNITDFNNAVSNGFLMYYEVQYKIKSVSGIPVEQRPFASRLFNATSQTIILDGLSQYTSYVFQAAVITKTGRGNFTRSVIIGKYKLDPSQKPKKCI